MSYLEWNFLFAINFISNFQFPASTGKLYVTTYDKPFYVPERKSRDRSRSVFGPLQELWTIQFSTRRNVRESVRMSNAKHEQDTIMLTILLDVDLVDVDVEVIKFARSHS